jgi:hypothetical protein
MIRNLLYSSLRQYNSFGVTGRPRLLCGFGYDRNWVESVLKTIKVQDSDLLVGER